MNIKTVIPRSRYLIWWTIDRLKVYFIQLFKGREAVKKYHLDKISEAAADGGFDTFEDIMDIIGLYQSLGLSPSDSNICRDIMHGEKGLMDDEEFRMEVTIPFLKDLKDEDGNHKGRKESRQIILHWLQEADDLKSHQVRYYQKTINEWLAFEDSKEKRA